LGGYSLAECSNCTFVFAPDAFSQVPDYNAVYESQEYREAQVDSVRKTDAGKEFARIATYAVFLRRVKPRGTARLLDVGCGVGRFALAAVDAGWNVTGIDPSETAIAIARSLGLFEAANATIEQVSGHIDVATAFEVLEHVADPVGLIRKMATVAPELFFTVPNWDWAPLHETTRPDWIPPIHLGFFRTASLRMAIEQAGLRVLASGVIGSDTSTGLKRLRRRLLKRPNEPMGLWVHAGV
jgi:SAM-dependent methyltransferase